jgi:hypothetical protein
MGTRYTLHGSYFASSMTNNAPSAATLPIDTSFSHRYDISRPSSSVHSINDALVMNGKCQPMDDRGNTPNDQTYPLALSPKAIQALVRTRPTVCVALTLNLFSFSVGGCRIVISNLSPGGAGAGTRAGDTSSLSWGLNFDGVAGSVRDGHGQSPNAFENLID